MPKTLSPHQTIHLDFSFIAHNINEINGIILEDTVGNNWICDNKSIIKAKKVYKNFIGDRIPFTSMGDVLDENKLSDWLLIC